MEKGIEPIHYRLTVTEDGDDNADRQRVRRELIAYNVATLPAFFDSGDPILPLNVFLHDEAGALIGGVTGQTSWDNLIVDYLWVDDSHRGHGLGRQLIEPIEAEARERGATWAWLSTFDFQARGFYQELGYRVVGRLDDYPPGHTYYWMRHDFE